MNHTTKLAILPIALLLGCLVLAPFAWKNVTEQRQAQEDRAYTPESPKALIEAAAETLHAMIDAGTPEIEIDADSGIDTNTLLDTTTTDWLFITDYEDQISYVFDANSDPLMVGTIMVTWMKSGAPYSTNIELHVPLKDKAIYDAIYYKKPERTEKCRNNK